MISKDNLCESNIIDKIMWYNITSSRGTEICSALEFIAMFMTYRITIVTLFNIYVKIHQGIMVKSMERFSFFFIELNYRYLKIFSLYVSIWSKINSFLFSMNGPKKIAEPWDFFI